MYLLLSPSFCPDISPKHPQSWQNVEFLSPKFPSSKPLPSGLSPCVPSWWMGARQGWSWWGTSDPEPGQFWVHAACPSVNIRGAAFTPQSVQDGHPWPGSQPESCCVLIPREQTEHPLAAPPLTCAFLNLLPGTRTSGACHSQLLPSMLALPPART